jgi:hypothetical protein
MDIMHFLSLSTDNVGMADRTEAIIGRTSHRLLHIFLQELSAD